MKKDGVFTAASGMELYKCYATVSGTPLANVVLLHGYGDHCSRYAWVMDKFNEAGMAVYAYDQRGHGRSPGKRAYIHRFEYFLDDLDAFMGHVGRDLSAAPVFIMGHSMGGMVLARYAQTRKLDVRGLIFSSPFLAFSESTPEFLLALGPYIAKVVPWLPIGAVDNSGLSRDPAVLEETDKDPFAYHGRVAARTGAEFYRIIHDIENDLPRIAVPFLVMHGSDDSIVSPTGSQALHDKAGARDKTLRIFDGGFHELFNDLDKEEFMMEIVTWIKARL